jgi:urea carboxylase
MAAPFDAVLVANRGAVAMRIIATLRRLGLTSVAVYADDDAGAAHVAAADVAVALGGGGARDTYLDGERLIATALAQGAGAIHPGYGFLSENPRFVERCEAAGLVFLGPDAVQIRAFGLKHTARQLAEQAGLPLLPGSPLVGDLGEAGDWAARLGYPVIIKSTAGGGGIGMQICRSAERLERAFDGARQQAEASFSDAGVFLE